MFRCYFTRSGHIAMGDNLDVATLEEAIAAGKKMLAESAVVDNLDGIEVWDRATFLYASRSGVQEEAPATEPACTPFLNRSHAPAV